MRKITLLSILLALTMVLFAKHVPMETAKSVAKTFWEQNVLKGDIYKAGNVFNDISGQTEFTNLYIFNTNGGFVIVSADDAAKPILGYSQQGSFDPNNIPVNARSWLKGYNREIQYAIDVEDNNLQQDMVSMQSFMTKRDSAFSAAARIVSKSLNASASAIDNI